MKRIWSLYKKELRGYFNSPIAYIVVTVFLLIVGYLFFQGFFLGGQAVMRQFFLMASFALLLVGPAITMKLFSEEIKQGTIEPLLTMPVREYEIVLGKFFSAWTLLLTFLALTFTYPICISLIGNLDWGPVIGGYIGLILMGGTFVALGIFASSFTKNQVISLIVALAISLVLLAIQLILPFIPTALQTLFEYIGFYSHFDNFSRGVVDTRDLIYSLSFMAILLFFSVQVLQRRLNDHTAKYRLNKLLYILAAIGCLVSLNLFSFNAYGRVDMTEDRMYSLDPASKQLVSELPDQIVVRAFFSKGLSAPFNNHARYLRDKLEEYRNYSSGKFNFKFIDPDEPTADGKPNPDVAAIVAAAKIPKVEVQTLEKDQLQMKKVYMGVAIYFQDKVETIPVVQKIDDLEYDITSRIAKLVRDKTPKVGFLTGHGELGQGQGADNAIKVLGDKFEVAPVDFKDGYAALNGVDILIIAGPKQPLTEEELFFIDQFIMEGGKAAFFVDAFQIDVQNFIGRPFDSGLPRLIDNYGVHIGKGMVLDQSNQRIALTRMQGNIRYQSLVAFPPFVRIQDMKRESPLVKNLRDLTIPFVSPLTLSDAHDVEAEVIAKSSPYSWLFEFDDSFSVEPQALPIPPGEGKYPEPMPLVVTLSGQFDSYFADREIPVKPGAGPVSDHKLDVSPQNRLVVVGSSTWLADQMQNRLGVVFYANLVDWLAQNEEMIGIRTRAITNRPLDETSPAVKALIKYGNMILMPLLFIGFGVFRWRLRARRKRIGYDL